LFYEAGGQGGPICGKITWQMENDFFQNSTLGQLSLSEVINQIEIFLEANDKAEYSLVIGTDSKDWTDGQNGNRQINLVTAIVVHRRGFGGRYFWQRKKISRVHTLREKIYAETLASLSFASYFVPLLKKSLNGDSPNYHLEIHVDVGEHGETREMIREVVGMVNGNGYVAKTKPYAFAASYVADKHT